MSALKTGLLTLRPPEKKNYRVIYVLVIREMLETDLLPQDSCVLRDSLLDQVRQA